MLVTAVNKNTLEVIKRAALSKLTDEWIVVDDSFIKDVPRKYWLVEGDKLIESPNRDQIDFDSAKRVKNMLVDAWFERKNHSGIEIDDGIVLPSNTDNAVQLQVYLSTIQKDEPIIVTDINGTPHLLELKKLVSYITIYQTEFKTRRAVWFTLKNQINQASSQDELDAIIIPE
jgi:hypothetical protein